MAPLSLGTFEARLPELLDLLQRLTVRESPTTDKAAVDRLGTYLARLLRARGARVRRFRRRRAGDHWLATWGRGRGGVLLLAHLDTVHPVGTLQRAPWRLTRRRAYGPGVLDMKAGIAMAVVALDTLRRHDRLPGHRVSLLCTSDEETGSHTSRRLIERLALTYDVVLCLEPALPGGALKTARKGVGIFEVETLGRAAHAGVEPEAGVNAVHEMAQQVLRLAALADPGAGSTVNVTVIEGGQRSNVIPDRCRAVVDVRVPTEAERRRLDRAFKALAPATEGAGVRVRGEWNRPPMARTRNVVRAFRQARAIAAQLGLDLSEGETGGGSDASLVAPLGVPVLDGLGAIGGGAHSLHEYVEVRSLPQRTALLAALISEWPAGG